MAEYCTLEALTMKFFASRAKVVRRAKDRSLYRKEQKQNAYLKEVIQFRKTIPYWDNFFSDDAWESRDDSWTRFDVLGQPLCEKYSWAIPDERALNILRTFSPLIEIGAGKGYWASLLQASGVDIVAFDRKVPEKCFTNVEVGGPKLLSKKEHRHRTLFLCYPDDTQNMSMKCLEHYTGEYIIHVGELLTTGTYSGYPQAPFGRTTSSEFSVQLVEEFHCLLTARIPRFPFSNDCISVWKRTRWVEGRSDTADDDDASKSEENEGSQEEEQEEGNYWADIPLAERMPLDRAAPCLEHLL